MKMVFAIVNKDDSGVVSEALTQEGFFVTKIATKGGFLSAGNTTLITGTDDDKVDQVIQIIEEHSKSRKELVSIGSYRHRNLLSLPCGGYCGRCDDLRFARRAVRKSLKPIFAKKQPKGCFFIPD